MILYLREIAVKPELIEYVFMDTGWENIQTYEYLDYLENELDIKINRIRSNITVKPEHEEIYQECLSVMGRDYSDFVAMILNQRYFPYGRRQFCTSLLKVEPFQLFIDNLDYQTISCVGIRREESHRRSTYPEWEFNESFDFWN
mgnify:FL=1